jgi:hypothetical protein
MKNPINIKIKYDEIINYLEIEQQKNPERDWSFLDLLVQNTQNALQSIVNGDDTNGHSIAITLDHDKQEVTIFGEQIIVSKSLDVLVFMKNKPTQQQIYLLFSEAIDYANRTWLYDSFFEEINSKKSVS